MPIYEYQCDGCQEVFEVFQKVSDPAPTQHSCGSTQMHRVLSNTSFVLKGTGWYITDYGRGGDGGKPKKDGDGGGEGKSEGGSDSKSSEGKSSEGSKDGAKDKSSDASKTKSESSKSPSGGGSTGGGGGAAAA